MKNSALKFLTPAIIATALCLLCASAKAQNYFFDVNGTTSGFGIANGGSYSWDDPNWDTNSAGTGPTIATWPSGQFARFDGGVSGNSYTVTVNNDESMAGLFQEVNGVSLTINSAGSGTLDILQNGPNINNATNDQGFLNGGSSATLTINAVISGTGGIDPQNGGTINLYGVNTYSGPTVLSSSSTLVGFNNNSSFGSGTIYTPNFGSSSFAPLIAGGGSTITLANNWVNGGTGGGVNFGSSANTPVVLTGTVSVGTTALSIRNNGNSTAPLTIKGVISGSTGGNLIFSGANGGTIHLSGANTYTGTTTIGVTGDTAITLELDAANTIASSSEIILAGGTLMPTVNQTMVGTLGLTTSSTINFDGGTLAFAKSSALTWSGKLDLLNWDGGDDLLQIGTDATGLTGAQLADIEFDGDGTSEAAINAEGFVIEVPEPTTLALAGLGGLSLLFLKRRKA